VSHRICNCLLCVVCLSAIACNAREVEFQPRAQSENRPVASATPEQQGLLEDIRAEFQRRNPKIVTVRVLDSRPPFPGSYRRLVVGWGIREDGAFKGDFNDELFGVFVANDSLTAIERTVDIFPTERWGDYDVRIQSSKANTVTIVGRGDTYGDSRMRRTYDWHGSFQGAPN